jgi:cephalosporin-C deacetylase-like acetyl esterase
MKKTILTIIAAVGAICAVIAAFAAANKVMSEKHIDIED